MRSWNQLSHPEQDAALRLLEALAADKSHRQMAEALEAAITELTLLRNPPCWISRQIEGSSDETGEQNNAADQFEEDE